MQPMRKVVRGKEAIKKFQEQISPKGMIAAEAAAKKALEQKYPGMFNSIPEKRTTAGVKKSMIK
jgi:hypothetical protein